MINLPELKVFVAAAEELNFSRAAERLHLSQSAVSQNIQSIERNYGVELFVRHGRSVQLSEAGLTLLPLAREVLNATRLLEDTLLNAKDGVAGELSIGCATTSGRYFIPNLLARFQQDCPNVRTRVSLMSRQAVLNGLMEQTLQLGVIGRCADHRELECQPVFEDRVILIVPPGHPWTQLEKIQPEAVLEEPFISREHNSGTYEVLFDNLRRHGLEPDNMNVVMELGDAEAVQMAVERGVGITFISEMMASRSLALGRVKKVVVEGLNVTQRVYLARHVASVYTRAETKLWDYVCQNREALTADLLYNLANVTPS
jgi:DNA-binding transcriptional LysR family regulator